MTSMPLSSVAENSSRWPTDGVASSRRLHGGQEPEVGHVVGLVEHGHLDAVEVAVALLDQVLEPAGAGDEDVDAAAQRGDLWVLADAAEDGGDAQRHRRGQGRDGLGHLVGELAGGHEHQGAGPAGQRGGCCDAASAIDERDGEGDGLAAAGRAAAEHVTAGERVGQGGGLDRERRRDAGRGRAPR